MKRIATLFLSLLTLMITCILPPAAAADTLNEADAPVADKISVSAYAAYLMDMDTGMTLYAYHADDKNYPASTTKIMTAYLCLKFGAPKDTVTVNQSAFSDLSQMASTGGLAVGETMTVHRALQALLVVSASEAANVIAEYISGSREEFVDLMNREAEALGCTGTHFANCHGLPNSDHYTTAHDLALIAQAAMEYPEFRDIVGNAVTTMEATNLHSEQTITSTNGLLPGSSYPDYSYPYAIGIKTGHTSVAGYCLVSAADKDGQRLLCVVMGCDSRTASFSQSTRLFDWGYENYEALTYGQEVPDPELPDESDNQDSLLENTLEDTPEAASADAKDSAIAPKEIVMEIPAPSSTPESGLPSTAVSPAPSQKLSSSMLSVVICLLIAAVLVIVLIIVLLIILLRKRQ